MGALLVSIDSSPSGILSERDVMTRVILARRNPATTLVVEVMTREVICVEPSTPARGGYRPWAELLRRTFAIDVLECPACKGRMKLVAMVTEPRNIARFLSALGEPTDVPARSPNRGPPYWKSTVLRRKAPGDAA
ncbi:hypothetical protein [Sorangium sp. So ce117]|uniref:hypothetical protein n=1 Tax=Sorangium sp. So ce117 TaxID=3133277 RepID=UPI003F5E540B